MADPSPATPPIVQYFIAELLRHSERLAVEAMAMNTGSDLTEVSFFCEGWVLTAQYDLEAAEFVQLVATPNFEQPPGEPEVCYTISPPEGVRWR